MAIMRQSESAQTSVTPPLLPLSAAAGQAQNRIHEMLRIVFLGAMMISSSAGVISFNKYLIAGPFPFAAHLVLGHMAFGSCFSALLYATFPSLFPSLKNEDKMILIDRHFIFRRVLPIGALFAGSLVLSNMAYFYLSVAFLQMMKETNVVLVYVLSLAVGVEAFKVRNLCVLVFIMVGTAMTVMGEMHFLIVGVLIQVCSQLFEVARLVLQQTLLTGKGVKLDVMSYNLVVMPLCFLTLSAFLLVKVALPAMPGTAIATPQLSDISANAGLLLANMLLAFFLNISIALFIKYSSATSTVLAMIIKDVVVVLSSVIFMHAVVTRIQVVGLSFQIAGVSVWSMMRSFPDKFHEGVTSGLVSLLKGEDTAARDAPVPIAISATRDKTAASGYGAATGAPAA